MQNTNSEEIMKTGCSRVVRIAYHCRYFRSFSKRALSSATFFVYWYM